MERMLHRLSCSSYADSFVLKGALLISDDEDIGFADEDEAQRILSGIMALYNDVNTSVLEHSCSFTDELDANLDEDSSIGQWSRGFLVGHDWLAKTRREDWPTARLHLLKKGQPSGSRALGANVMRWPSLTTSGAIGPITGGLLTGAGPPPPPQAAKAHGERTRIHAVRFGRPVAWRRR